MTTPDTFIAQLQATPAPPATTNEYDDQRPENALRRANLRRYLLDMAERQPDTLLVMEAPGYRGCRLTGVPVTSRKILLQGLPELALFGRERGYQDVPEAGFERIQGEQSATIVWGTLSALGAVPLIWNTFPFHPHQPEKPLSNRKPRRAEIALGEPFLQTLLDWFQPRRVVAVGNVAHATLNALGRDAVKVRHPAQGGKNDFVAGLRAVFSA